MIACDESLGQRIHPYRGSRFRRGVAGVPGRMHVPSRFGVWQHDAPDDGAHSLRRPR